MNKILDMKFGSHLYGTDTSNSDLDFKAIYIPTAREIVLGQIKETITTSRNKADCERNTKDDIDTETFSLCRYLDLLCQGQTVALDFLFGARQAHLDNQLVYTDQGIGILKEIYDNREKLLTKNVQAFVGYARQQAAKYGIKGSRMDALKTVMENLELYYYQDRLSDHKTELEALVNRSKQLVSLEKTPLIEIVLLKGPTGLIDQPHLHINGRYIGFHSTVKYAKEIIRKMLDSYGARARKAHLDGGVDWKALSHAVRVNSEAEELLLTNFITFPRPDKELLLKIKTGQLPYEQVAEIIEEGLPKLYTAQEKSSLRDKPDIDWVNDFVYNIYSEVIKNA